MLLQFEICGQDTTGSSYAFRLDQALNFTRLVLKDVRLVCGNDRECRRGGCTSRRSGRCGTRMRRSGMWGV